jgi:uncharacterized membrane protein required for colicin V production
MSISLYYDLFFVVFLLLFFFIFYKKGFVGTFIKVFGLVIAFLAGNYLSNSLSKPIYDRFIKERLQEYVVQKILKLQSGVSDAFSNGIIGKLFGNFIKEQSLDTDAAELADRFINHSLESNCINVIRMVTFVLIFILALIILSLLSNVLEGVNELPIVGFPNQLLGGALGLIIGLVILFILCSIISLILGIWEAPWMNKEVIEGSFLFSKLFELNPFYSETVKVNLENALFQM